MSRVTRLLVTGLLLVALSVLVAPLAAQEDLPEGAGEGGVLLTPNIGDDPSTFNPIISADTASSAVHQWLYPDVIGINPATGAEEPNVKQALATSIEFNDDGTVATVSLRDDLVWNDGTPITAADYLWAFDAVRSGETSSARTYVFETLADGTPGGGKIVSVEAPDEFTLEVTFSEPDCIAINDLNDIPVVPAHVFEELYGEDYSLMDEEPRRIPEVSYGPFRDIEFAPGERVSMLPDQTFAGEAELGYVSPSEWVYLSVPDTNVAVERFIAEDLTFMSIPSERQEEFRDNPDFQVYETSQNGFQYMGYNLADPENPQPGLDEDGNVIEQDPHPIFADVQVRRALAHAVDVDAIIDGVLDGNGIRAVTHTIPTSWAQADLDPYAYDPEMALEMLAEAGWVDDDNDPSTPLICDGCFYAENVDPEFAGSPFTFRLQTNAGNVARERIGEIIDSQLSDIGVEVDFEAIDFGTLVDVLQGQTFDAIIIGWSLGLPIDPDVTSFYTPSADVPGSGFGLTSYNNPELNDLLAQARNPLETNGCDVETRAEIYEEIQTILYEDQPYMYLYVANVMSAAQGYLENWDPVPFDADWNIDAFAVEN
jgi:peptide/nickel transport system substrate-binding protein